LPKPTTHQIHCFALVQAEINRSDMHVNQGRVKVSVGPGAVPNAGPLQTYITSLPRPPIAGPQ